MKYVGMERVVTLSYQDHKTAEDYAAGLATPLSLKGSYRVVKTVTKYKTHEDSIQYNTFLANQQKWKRENGYQCTTITGKSLFVPTDELGGNCILLEGTYQGEIYQIGLYHLDQVYVKEGEIITNEKVLGTQGNTGLVLSAKPISDFTYGTHVHVEVKNQKGVFLNPRPFASEEKTLSYQEEIVENEKTSPEKEKEDGNCGGGILLFTCPRDDTYYLKLKKGEQLYVIAPTS